MAVPDASSYYFGLGMAIVLGYVLSSLRIERLLIAAIMLLPQQAGGKPLKKERISDENNISDAQETFSMPRILRGLTEESIYELERRAVFSKACNSNVLSSKNLTRSKIDLAFCHPYV